MSIKEQLYNSCKNFIDERLTAVQSRISNIQESLQSETKSSAGDKHETGRAMLQLEREKAGNQFIEIKKQQELLAKVSIASNSDVARLGSLVITTNGVYFLAISLGLLKIDAENYYVISPNTPIGKLILGKRVGDTFSFNGITITITGLN